MNKKPEELEAERIDQLFQQIRHWQNMRDHSNAMLVALSVELERRQDSIRKRASRPLLDECPEPRGYTELDDVFDPEFTEDFFDHVQERKIH